MAGREEGGEDLWKKQLLSKSFPSRGKGGLGCAFPNRQV